jgi:hypothetical protein
MIVVKIVLVARDGPPGKLADAELHFRLGPLEGMKLVGFGIWEHANGVDLTVTFPTDHYSVNGERRRFVLLRPIADQGLNRVVRDLILDAYAAYESTVL